MLIPFRHLKKQQEFDVNKIIAASLKAADPFVSISKCIRYSDDAINICGRKYDLEKINRIYLVGTGKAVIPMTSAAMEKIGEVVDSGIVISKHFFEKQITPEKIRVLYGSHPIPSKKSVSSTRDMVRFLEQAGKDDLIINLISGGGSSLMTQPCEGLNLRHIQELTETLIKCGASIQEINTIRKHVDRVKGGGLARIAKEAAIETLIVSDVLGNDISMIASGPTSPDVTTFEDAIAIIKKYELENSIPCQIYDHLILGMTGKIEETLKPDSPIFGNKNNHIVASLSDSITQAASTAERLGYQASIISTNIVGEAREIGKMSGSILKTLASTELVSKRPAVIIGGGETTVKVVGTGKGGRNQEIAFGAMEIVSGCKNCALITLATDGEDGPTNAAGAYITGETISRAKTRKLDPNTYGKNNDTYTFFDELDNLVITGPTGTNVNDLIFLFAF